MRERDANLDSLRISPAEWRRSGEERRCRYVKYSCAPLHGEWGECGGGGGCQVEEGVSEWRRGGG